MGIFFLAKQGYGTVDQIEEWDSPKFLDALEYESICADLIAHEHDKQ